MGKIISKGVTIAASTVTGDTLPIGTEVDYDGTTVPSGWEETTSIFDLIYPIGSIYMSVNSTNPSTLFGGTWVSWGTGRVPVGIDTNDTDFNTVEKTGGASTVTLTLDQMPPHSHAIKSSSGYGDWNNQAARGNNVSVNESMPSKYTGEGLAHENKMKYITCYMWKRTA